MTDTLTTFRAEMAAMDGNANRSIRDLVPAVAFALAAADPAMIERLARVIAYELGDTMGDTRGVFWSGQSGHQKENWQRAAERLITTLIEASRGESDNG